jgi:DNA-binding transcriptional ArsR family regulator
MAVSQIAEELEVPQSLVSFHLAQLKRVHLVSGRRNGKRVYYFLNRKLVAILERAIAYLAPDIIGRAPT